MFTTKDIVDAIAFHINYITFNEGRMTEKNADVLASRLITDLTRIGVPIDANQFYKACGLNEDKIPEGKEYN